jgi:polar amino acid transport system permease protein
MSSTHTDHRGSRAPTRPSARADDVVALPLRHPGRWMTAAVVTMVAIGLLNSLWRNENIDHASIRHYLLDPRVLSGVVLTLALTALSMSLATALAVLLAVMRLSANPILRAIGSFYVWFFRGTPLLVQVVFWGYLGLLYAEMSVGIPFTSITLFSGDTNRIVTPFVAGVLALALNEAAYASEIVRAGLLSVDPGHVDAAQSLGMTPGYTLRRIVLPQAMRFIIPPMGNQTISMLKNTALLELIAVHELYTQTSLISSQNLRQVELLIVASIWYLILTSILSVPQFYLERRFGRGSSTPARPTPVQQARAMVERMRASLHQRKTEAPS